MKSVNGNIKTTIQSNQTLRDIPELMTILLKDRTTKKNIIWATDSYSSYGPNFYPEANINYKSISNGGRDFIKPRVEKNLEEQKERTKINAEVFTPTWVVKKQNDLIEEEFKNLPLEDYVNKTWLEITCGEAPYMVTRYDTVTGKRLPINDRVGFVDRKLQRISNEVDNFEEWLELVIKAYKASYGYEFQGDSLMIARENLLYTFIEYYEEKFFEEPMFNTVKEIAKIISYNLFQMDGLKYIIPLSEMKETKIMNVQISLFENMNDESNEVEVITEGIKALIKNWSNQKLIQFESLVKGDLSL